MADTDIIHEGRISSLETKVDTMVPLIMELHSDMLGRRARWSLVSGGIKYVAWCGAGLAGLLGFAKSAAVASWLDAFPHH